GEGSALVVPGSCGRRTKRRIHRTGTEKVLGAARGEGLPDPAAACAEHVDLRCEMHAPVQRHQCPAAEWREHQHPLISPCEIGVLGIATVSAIDVSTAADSVGEAAGTAGGHGVDQVDPTVAVEHD